MPANTSTSYGLDLLINNWSLGTFLQDLQQSSSSSNNGNVHMVVFQVGYSFGNADQLAKEKEEASLNSSGSENQNPVQNPPAQKQSGNEFESPKM
jgi:hypothetical protein